MSAQNFPIGTLSILAIVGITVYRCALTVPGQPTIPYGLMVGFSPRHVKTAFVMLKKIS